MTALQIKVWRIVSLVIVAGSLAATIVIWRVLG